jgi:regulatory protein
MNRNPPKERPRTRSAFASRSRLKAHDDGGFEQFGQPEADTAPTDPQAAPIARTARRTGLSLLARAIGYLSRREHSRAELARKLQPHAVNAGEDEAAIEQLLDQLVAKGLLSDERFAASLTHRRGQRYGTARVMMELRQQGVAPEVLANAQSALKDTELDRAREVWRRKFGEPAESPADRARQLRFLQARGFSSAVCYRVVRGSDESI